MRSGLEQNCALGSLVTSDRNWVTVRFLGLDRAFGYRPIARHPPSGSVVAQELVIEYGRRESDQFGVARIFAANNSSLAEHTAVFLAGDFLGHLEYHFDQRVI